MLVWNIAIFGLQNTIQGFLSYRNLLFFINEARGLIKSELKSLIIPLRKAQT